MALEEIDTEAYDPWQRAFNGFLDPEMLIGAIDDYETAIKAHRKAHEYDAPKEHKERIAEKLREYSNE